MTYWGDRVAPARWGILVLLLTLVAFLGAWYLASPWWTLWKVKAAARDHPEKLSSYVDFEVLTRRARSGHLQFWKSMLEMYSKSTHPSAQFHGARAAERVRGRGLDISVSAADLRPWLASIPLDPATLAGLSSERGYRPYIVRHGLRSFEVRDWNGSIENGPVLTFDRQGLCWRLEGVRFGQQ